MSRQRIVQATVLVLAAALSWPALALAREPTDADRAKAESLYKVALIAIDNRDWEIARKNLQDILAIVPDQPRALLRLAEAELNLGRPDAAKKDLEKAQAAGLPESDKPVADDLGPKIDYAIEKQASEAPAGEFPRYGWRVQGAGIGHWRSWSDWAIVPALFPGDSAYLFLVIIAPSASGVEQEIPYDWVVFDGARRVVWEGSDTLTNVKDQNRWILATPLGTIASHPQTTLSELTVELRSGGELVVRIRIPVAAATDPPSSADVQRLVGRWRGRGKGQCQNKLDGTLDVTAFAGYPEFVYQLRAHDRDHPVIYHGRLIPDSAGRWLGANLTYELSFSRTLAWDSFLIAPQMQLSLEEDGSKGLRISAIPFDCGGDIAPSPTSVVLEKE